MPTSDGSLPAGDAFERVRVPKRTVRVAVAKFGLDNEVSSTMINSQTWVAYSAKRASNA
jgi:hypothetical protein